MSSKDLVGKELPTKDGSKAVVIEYIKGMAKVGPKLRIMFDDEEEGVYDPHYAKSGQLCKPSNRKSNPSVAVGDRFESNLDGWITVVEYSGKNKVVVEFEDGQRQTTQVFALRAGQVAKPGRAAKGVNAWCEKVNKIYGDKFIFDSSNYKNARSMVTAVCSSCGAEYTAQAERFSQDKPYVCVCNKESYYSKFLDKAAEVHCGKYQYVLDGFKNTESPLICVCPYHGEFVISVGSHLRGRGCPTCEQSSKRQLKILKSIPLDTVVLTEDKESVWLKHKCGTAYKVRTENIATRKTWCPYCYEPPQRVTFDVFKERAYALFGDRYSYTNFSSISEPVTIVDSVCGGEFTTHAGIHISGNYGKGIGCPHCATYGFNPSRDAYLYLLRDAGNTIIKVGITHQEVKRRIQQIHKRSGGHKFVEYNSWRMDGSDARRLENEVHKYLGSIYQQPEEVWDGSTECFYCSAPDVVEDYINSLI